MSIACIWLCSWDSCICIVGPARINVDFKRIINGQSADDAYFKLAPEMRKFLMAYALLSTPAVQKEEKVQMNVQREAKLEKRQLLHEKEMLACQREYGDKLTYIEMSISQRFWKTKAIATKEYKELESKTAKVNTMVKEQIKIRVIKMLLSLPLWCF
jgi:parvulin-like peptidyl-prolyl isomerase